MGIAKSSIRYQIDTLLLIARTTTDEQLKNELCQKAELLLLEFSSKAEDKDYDAEYMDVYKNSKLRNGILSVINTEGTYVGSFKGLREKMEIHGYVFYETTNQMLKIVREWRDIFLKVDGIAIKILANGNGGNRYKVYRLKED